MSYGQSPQDVTTWHNDNNRTGWQANEPTLTADPTKPGFVSQGTFGLLQRWPVNGYVYAQPLAVANVTTSNNTCHPCNLVLVATEQDLLYAFNASTNSATPVWTLDLANYVVVGGVHGKYLNCSSTSEEPCPSDVLGPNEGVTGTPVIDMQTNLYTLYVVAAVQFGTTHCQNNDPICFYVFAVDIRTGSVISKQLISGTVNGYSPIGGSGICTSDFPSQGPITFEYHHIQRPALLLLPNGTVYVAFASGLFVPGNVGEGNNGWMFTYTLNGTTLGQTVVFNSTPYGTGGGIWQSGGGPAYDGTHIYANTANGTLFDASATPYDYGDSLLQLDPTTLAVTDFYAPSDVFSYPGDGTNGTGLCKYDEDFGSAGVLLPTNFTYTGSNGSCDSGCNVVITADKQSNLHVVNRANLGKYYSDPNCANDPNNIQCLTTPVPKVDGSQGYWGSPAYWNYNDGQDHYLLYYSATVEGAPQAAPLPINGYSLLTSAPGGPIPTAPTASTSIKFCQRSPTPAGSWDGSHAISGIVWAIEHQNSQPNNTCPNANYLPNVALHAFKATDLTATELYTSRPPHLQTTIGNFTKFSTPTIFKGQVYVGTQTEVDVFGLCASQLGGCKP